MASNWRGYRPFVLEGLRFRWACHFHYPIEILSVSYARRGRSWKPDALIVRPEDGPHRLLTVTWPACHGPLVKPRLVRACMDEALRRGWLRERPTLTLNGPTLSVAGANQPNHELVDIVRDIVAGKLPHHPKVRRLE